MDLTVSEKCSPLWQKLERLLEEDLHDAHVRLEGTIPDEQTHKLRGRIGYIRKLLRLGDEEPHVA